MARYMFGVSPAALWLAWADWSIHLAASPGKRAGLAEKGVRKLVRFIATNPEVLSATMAEGGMNFARGALNFWLD